MDYENEYDENKCYCGKCRLCLAYAVSDDDTDNDVCGRCNGGGCTSCED